MSSYYETFCIVSAFSFIVFCCMQKTYHQHSRQTRQWHSPCIVDVTALCNRKTTSTDSRRVHIMTVTTGCSCVAPYYDKVSKVTPLELITAYNSAIRLGDEIVRDIGWVNRINTPAKSRAVRCKYWIWTNNNRMRSLLSWAEHLLAGEQIPRKQLTALRKSASHRWGKGVVLTNPDTGKPYTDDNCYQPYDKEEYPFSGC